MTPEEVRARVDRLRTKATGDHGDSETDHGEEDAIYFSVLAEIAVGTASNSVQCAAEAVKAADIEFSRWYA